MVSGKGNCARVSWRLWRVSESKETDRLFEKHAFKRDGIRWHWFVMSLVNTIRVYILCQMTFERMTRRFVWRLPKKTGRAQWFFLIKRQKINKLSNIKIVRFRVNGTHTISNDKHVYMVLNGNLFLLFYVSI